MTAEEQAPENGGMEFDEIVIDGHTYRCRKEIVDEIVALRMAGTREYADRVALCDPTETATVVITTPSNASDEFRRQVAEAAKANFPDHYIAVMPEGLALHTAEGLHELLVAGAAMENVVAEVVRSASKNEKENQSAFIQGFRQYIEDALEGWRKATEGRDDEAEDDTAG